MNQNLHLKLKSEDIAKYVLLAGDPARLDVVKEFLDSSRELFYEREFRAIKGSYQGIPVLAVSTGIGAPSTAIVVEELIQLGVKVFIRIGTCGGSWRQDISVGSLIIPSACVREDGTSQEYLSRSFPSVADYQVISALAESADSQKAKYYVGINRTHDAFYGNVGSKLGWQKTFQNLGIKESPIISSDMETSIIFVLAGLRGVKAGAVLAVNADPEPLMNKELKNPVIEFNSELSKKVIKQAIKVALESLVILEKI